ncbi:unnamed protein product [Rotaria sp. Silwood1]|nr:unnamed protein product [Rotaria sp. Silwood1]
MMSSGINTESIIEVYSTKQANASESTNSQVLFEKLDDIDDKEPQEIFLINPFVVSLNMSESESNPNQEKKRKQQQQQQPSTSSSTIDKTESTSEAHVVSLPKRIRLYDAQTGVPVGIYLENDNTLNLKNVQLIYPTATTVKCFFPGQTDPDLSPIGIWPDDIYEPVLPSYAIPPIVNLVQSQSRGYAPCQLINLYKPNLCLDAEFLVDCGLTGGIAARGFNNRITTLPKYEDVKIIVNLKHSTTGHVTTKSAIISIFERLPLFTSDIGIQCSNDLSSDETQTTTSSYLLSPQRNSEMITSTMSVDDNPESNVAILKLSPLKHPIKDGDQYGILGFPAMTKLNIGIHFGGNYIFGVERLFEHV